MAVPKHVRVSACKRSKRLLDWDRNLLYPGWQMKGLAAIKSTSVGGVELHVATGTDRISPRPEQRRCTW